MTPSETPPSLVCKKCGANRYKEPCKIQGGPPIDCPLGGTAAHTPSETPPNNDEVICPNCVHQFRAIPINVQKEIAELERRASPPEQPSFCWLIERGQPEKQEPTLWWRGAGQWTATPHEAMRFSNKSDAEAHIAANYLIRCRAVAHVFLPPEQPESAGQCTPAPSETPLTDTLVERHKSETKALNDREIFADRHEWCEHSYRQACELLDHARQLERQLAAARAALRDARNAIVDAQNSGGMSAVTPWLASLRDEIDALLAPQEEAK